MRKSSIILAGAGLTAILALVVTGILLWHSSVLGARGKAAARAGAGTAGAEAAAKGKPGGAAPVVVKFARNPETAPPFLMADLDGQPISSAAYPGKVVLLSFWATWCPPCRLEIPELISLQAKYKDKLQIIGISEDDADTPAEVAHVKDVAAQIGINYPVVMATKDVVDAYGGVPALPTTFVLNTSGKVVQKHVGLVPTEDFDNEIRLLLDLPVNATVEAFDDTGQIFLKNASLATELPGVDFSGLTPDQKREALKRMNSENCTCGCGLTIAECRINDSECDISTDLAKKIVKEVAKSMPAAHPAAFQTKN
jgi:thiol-disulfide isomerase/thioredoxin